MNSQLATTIAVLLVVVVLLHDAGPSGTLHLVEDSLGNEALVVEGVVGGRSMLFMVDTAYAGAPVLSTTYLATASARGSVDARYRAAVDAVRATPPAARHAALAAFLAASGCRSYTSGCTMRLMGIGATTEARADLLLCPDVALGDDLRGPEVFVTHPLPSSVHILTMDFLLHRAPCLLLPARGVLQCGASFADCAAFDSLEPTFVGGSVCVAMTVGGEALRIVLDTGSAAPLSLSRRAAGTITRCAASGMRATQRGIHGENVCSDVLRADVRVASIVLAGVQVFANAGDVEGADGYAGMGMLRALDLRLAPDSIGVRRSGLPTRDSTAVREGSCDGVTPLACAGP
jgi:hypothetical protein